MSYINPSSTLGASIALPTISIAAVALRFISRSKSHRGFGADDWLSIPALAFTWAVAIIMIYGVSQNVIGVHTPNVEALETEETTNALLLQSKLDYLLIPFSCLALGCIRLSVLFMYRRIFTGTWFKYCNWTLIGLIITWTIAFFIAQIAACGSHPAVQWEADGDQNRYCVGPTQPAEIRIEMAISDVILDFFILVLPIYPIYILQMRTIKKLTVIFIFLLGILATAAGIVRTAVIGKIYFTKNMWEGTFIGVSREDVQGLVSMPQFWTMIEVGVACVTCNLPAFPGLLRGAVGDHLRSWQQWISVSSLNLRRSSHEGRRSRHAASKEDMEAGLVAKKMSMERHATYEARVVGEGGQVSPLAL